MILLVMLLSVYPYRASCVASLRHYETLSYISERRHVKRSLSTHLQFQVFRRNFHLTLEPDSSLMVEGFRVHLIHEDGSSSVQHFHHNHVFSGHLTGRPDVRVHAHREGRLWTLQIFDLGDTYSLEPAWRLLTLADNPRNDTMIAYRASDLTSDTNSSSRFCGVRDHAGTGAISATASTRESVTRVKTSVFNASLGYSNKKIGVASRSQRSTDNLTCSLYLVGDYTFYSGRCQKNYLTCTAIMFSYVKQAQKIYKESVFEVPEGENIHGISLGIREIYLFTSYTKPMSRYPHVHFNEDKKWTIDDKLDAFSLYVSYMTHGKSSFCANFLLTDYPFPDRILGLAWIGSICSGHSCISMPNSGVCSGTDIILGHLPTLQMNLVFAHGHTFGSEHDPPTAECSTTDSRGGKFLMWSESVSGHFPNHFKFSPCSLRLIGSYLYHNRCFNSLRAASSFCGNGVVEEGEKCDAGVYGIMDTDDCCTFACQLRPHSACSDLNSACCRNCSMSAANTQCLARNQAECHKASFCTGQCYQGYCRNICEIKSIRERIRLHGCFCQSNEHGAACKSCCFDATNVSKPGPCLVFSNLTLTDGTPCFNGYCKNGVCQALSHSRIRRIIAYISEMHSSSPVTFMKDNIVFIVIVLSFFIWLPYVYLVSKTDKHGHARKRRMRSTKMIKTSETYQHSFYLSSTLCQCGNVDRSILGNKEEIIDISILGNNEEITVESRKSGNNVEIIETQIPGNNEAITVESLTPGYNEKIIESQTPGYNEKIIESRTPENNEEIIESLKSGNIEEVIESRKPTNNEEVIES